MKAMGIRDFGGRDRLEKMDVAVPEPGAGEIRIRVRAAGVNPVDWKIREGWLKERLPHQFPIILGWDAAGVVEKTGEGAARFRAGDEVYAYCRKPVVKDGTYAEYAVIPDSFAAAKPRCLTFEEAGAVPLAMLTAYQSLFDAVHLRPGETVLIHAAAGGVGTFAVQLARNAGARVIGTAGAGNREYLLGLGAEQVIDYMAEDFRTAVRHLYPDGIDVVYDCVGGEVLKHSPDVLRPGGRLVSILDPDAVRKIAASGIEAHYVFVTPSGAQLERIAAMFDQDRLRVNLSAVLPLEEAARAHEYMESRHTRGKVVLAV